MIQPWMHIPDLAPGDTKSAEKDWSAVQLFRIDHPEHPLFDAAYQHLWDQFGPIFEVESREVLLKRLNWAKEFGDLVYEMDLIMSGHDFVGVRDHSAILIEFHGEPAVVVHMSHNLVAPAWRRTGIAGWLRALPVETARHCLETNQKAKDSAIVLAGEMEYPDPQNEATLIRLKAYEKAGYLVVDPAIVNYFQPDFRPPEEIDRSGGPAPLPFLLVLRRVGREAERTITGEEVRAIVTGLYRMYGQDFRESDMAPLLRQLPDYPSDGAIIPLIHPSEVPVR